MAPQEHRGFRALQVEVKDELRCGRDRPGRQIAFRENDPLGGRWDGGGVGVAGEAGLMW